MNQNQLIRLAEYRTSDEFYTSRSQGSYEILFITEGAIQYISRGKAFVAQKGDMVILNNLKIDDLAIIRKPFKRYVLTVSSSVLKKKITDSELLSLFDKKPDNTNAIIHINSVSDMQSWLKKIITEMQFTNYDRFSEKLQDMYFEVILINAFRAVSTEDKTDRQDVNTAKTIFRVQSMLNESFKTDIKISSICDNVHISLPYFSAQFKKLTGLSPKQYLTDLRLNYAASQISNTDISIIDIAYSAGFSDINNFHRKFKEHFKMTPLTYRSEYKNRT